MTEIKNPPGTPSWADLSTGDLAGAQKFYSGLFGWEPRVAPEPEAGGYTLCYVDGLAVAGMGNVMTPGQPAAWAIYVSTEDADATAALVERNGGAIMAPPFDVMKSGRMAVFIDPTGAVIAAWQPYEMAGAELRNAPGALSWVELMTRDLPGSIDFYGRVFGWTARPSEVPGMDYTLFQLDGTTVAGVMAMTGDEWPADLPPHWMPYFEVTDPDASAARAQELGGRISVPPTTIPPGRFAVLSDPTGAVFSIIASTPL